MEKADISILYLTSRKLMVRVGRFFLKMGQSLVKPATIVELICAMLIVLFIYTGINKLIDNESFRTEMGRSPFIQDMANYIGVLLPLGELFIALLLIIKRTRLLGLYMSFFIMFLFTGYIWLMLNYAFDLPCSCGGIISKMSWNQHLYFNGIFTLMASTASILESNLNKLKEQYL